MRHIPIPEKHALPVFLEEDKGKKLRFDIDYHHEVRSLGVRVKPTNAQTSPVNGIFDTGAQSVCLKNGLPLKWGFTQVGEAHVSGATGSAPAKIWRGDLMLSFDNGRALTFRKIVAWETALPGKTDALIGQPIIKLFDFEVWQDFKGVTLWLNKMA